MDEIFIAFVICLTAQVLDPSSICTTDHTMNINTLQKHDAQQQVRKKLIVQICNIKLDNMVTYWLPFNYVK